MAINICGNKNNVTGTVIAVDQLTKTVRFCRAGKDEHDFVIDSVNYTVRPFDKEFYDSLARIIRHQTEKESNIDSRKVSLILPDQLFLLDMVTIPVINRKAMQNSLNLAIETIYKNADELNLKTYAAQRNKQTATYGLAGIRYDVCERMRRLFSENGINVSGITYVSNAAVNGAMALNPKLRNETFMLMDIKKDCTRFALVVRGCTMGYFDLPFGHSILHKSRLVSEDTLFDHRAGELLVRSAEERARAKQLTLEGEEREDSVAPINDSELNGVAPQTEAEYVYENFRIFLKWAYDLLGSNPNIVNLARMDTVCVNMPKEYGFLFDIVAKRNEGRGIIFAPLLADGEDSVLSANLELYGGYFLNKFNEVNTF